MFVHIFAVGRAGVSAIVEGQKLSLDVVQEGRTGKSATDNLRTS